MPDIGVWYLLYSLGKLVNIEFRNLSAYVIFHSFFICQLNKFWGMREAKTPRS